MRIAGVGAGGVRNDQVLLAYELNRGLDLRHGGHTGGEDERSASLAQVQ